MNFFQTKNRSSAAPALAPKPGASNSASRSVSAQTILPRASGKDRRRSPRYLCELRTACVVISLVEPVLLSARIRDVSQNGVGLLLPSRVHAGTFLAIKLQGPRDERPRIMRAQVVRIVPQPDRRTWFHGCAFVGELHREDVARLL